MDAFDHKSKNENRSGFKDCFSQKILSVAVAVILYELYFTQAFCLEDVWLKFFRLKIILLHWLKVFCHVMIENSLPPYAIGTYRLTLVNWC